MIEDSEVSGAACGERRSNVSRWQRWSCYELRTSRPACLNEAMRILLLAAACTLVFATAAMWGSEEALSDCAAIRGACIDHCFSGETNASRQSACRNRCAIAFCQDTPSVCRPTDQTVCNISLRSCNGACDAAASVPSALAQNQVACSRVCCVQFKACMAQRSCDTSTIACP